MEFQYEKIIEYILKAGKRLTTKAGNIADIGIKKKDLTEEDLAIEFGLKEIIKSFGTDHILYAEEEHSVFEKSENIWVADPISGTANFIQGLPHYAIVIAHLVKHKPVFAVVFDPSVNELFTAYVGKGAFLNHQPIQVSSGAEQVILRPSSKWQDPEVIQRVESRLASFTVEKNKYSMAVNYCAVAAGRKDGVVSFTKDTFPEFAGAFIVQEAGGKFTNILGEKNITDTDRIFVGGSVGCYDKLFPLVKQGTERENN